MESTEQDKCAVCVSVTTQSGLSAPATRLGTCYSEEMPENIRTVCVCVCITYYTYYNIHINSSQKKADILIPDKRDFKAKAFIRENGVEHHTEQL